MQIYTNDIEVGERHRALSEDAVKRLAASLDKIGLRHPITVRIVEEMEIDGHIVCGVPVLVAGHHRLAAAKLLAWEQIDCVEVDDNPIEAELWEISENLHRLDLTKEQRDEHIRRYAELLEAHLQSRQSDAIESKRDDGLGHRPEGVASKIAKETGLSKRTVDRALNPKPKKPKPVKSDHDVILAQANAIVAAWNRACPEAREIAFDQIDSPVFENTRSGQ